MHSLLEKCKDLHETEFSNKINVNDVILIKNPIKSRPLWLLSRVIELFSGNNHKVCFAQIKSGDGKVEIHRLKFKHLYLLEILKMFQYFKSLYHWSIVLVTFHLFIIYLLILNWNLHLKKKKWTKILEVIYSPNCKIYISHKFISIRQT